MRLPLRVLRPAAGPVLALMGAVSAMAPAAAVAQYRMVSPAGDTLAFTPDTLRRMLDTARALYADLQGAG
jgi:hypothetical protein